jgi:hypothetical protein
MKLQQLPSRFHALLIEFQAVMATSCPILYKDKILNKYV